MTGCSSRYNRHVRRLVSFEGLDGVGKTTHVQLLVNRLHTLGVDVSTYREPGGTPLGERVRELIQAGLSSTARSEMLLFATARAELVETRIKPDLAAGKLVILDRYVDSTFAYQGALGAPLSVLEQVCEIATGGLMPALTFWLDLEPVAALQRRYPLRSLPNSAQPEPLDAIEQRDLDYFIQVRDRYAALAERHPERISRVDAGADLAAVEEQIAQRVVEYFVQAPGQAKAVQP
jgi:dTMP kinase